MNITLKYIYRILSVPAYGLMYLFTGVMVLAGLPFVYFRFAGVVKAMMRFWAKGIFAILGMKINVRGFEKIPENLHFILVANHSSFFDIVAIVSVFPDLTWFGHERLLKIPVFRRILILTGYIPFRKTTYRNTKEMVDRLRTSSNSGNIAMFPEGTRTLNGKINDFYRGFIILLRSSDINVLPVTLNGFYDLKPKNRFFIDFSVKPEIIIHEPQERESLITMSDREIAIQIKSIIQSSIVPSRYSGEELTDENPNKIFA